MTCFADARHTTLHSSEINITHIRITVICSLEVLCCLRRVCISIPLCTISCASQWLVFYLLELFEHSPFCFFLQSLQVFTLLSQLQPAALTPDAFSYGAGFFAAEAAAWEVAVQLQCAMQTVDLGVEAWLCHCVTVSCICHCTSLHHCNHCNHCTILKYL